MVSVSLISLGWLFSFSFCEGRHCKLNTCQFVCFETSVHPLSFAAALLYCRYAVASKPARDNTGYLSVMLKVSAVGYKMLPLHKIGYTSGRVTKSIFSFSFKQAHSVS